MSNMFGKKSLEVRGAPGGAGGPALRGAEVEPRHPREARAAPDRGVCFLVILVSV